MKILAHRGYWNDLTSNNSPQAIRLALERGFGFESDIRDYCGKLVISHNIADSDCQLVEEVLRWLREFDDKCCFAVNIKADGLKELLLNGLKREGITNYFTFDMSIPQMIEYRDAGLRFFTRQSEVEPEPVMYDEADGVWIDGFFGEDWINSELLRKHIINGKTVCLVSPELHKRSHKEFWRRLKGYELEFEKVMLCTDYPDEAKKFFALEDEERK